MRLICDGVIREVKLLLLRVLDSYGVTFIISGRLHKMTLTAARQTTSELTLPSPLMTYYSF